MQHSKLWSNAACGTGGDGAESDCILQEQRVLEGGPKTDKDSFLTLVAEVRGEQG